MIEVRHLSKKFELSARQQKELQAAERAVFAVQDVSFTCQPGRIFSLLGANGAGKTTTLRMIATLIQPSAGQIRVAGYDVAQQPEQVRRRIGFLTGATNLYDRLTPLEAVRYFADLHGMPAAAFKARQEALFTQLRIHDFAHKQIGQLSTGMKQRVSIARTMIHDPAVVIFDEPTSGLDVISADSIIGLIQDCKQAGKTVIFSSHIMSEVDLLCDELAIIHQGRLIYASDMDTFRLTAGSQSLTAAFIQLVQTPLAA